MSPKDNQEFLWNTHSYINEYIRFGDAKAGIVIAWTTGLMGALVADNFFEKMLDKEKMLGKELVGYIALTGALLLLFAFCSAMWAILPNLFTSQKEAMIFWEGIKMQDKEKYANRAAAQSDNEACEQIAHHNHDLSGVCSRKYWWVGVSMWLAGIGSLLLLVPYVFP